jgi:multidrug efflux pump subunit AcrA (membrane-fusion protein)
MYVIVDVADHHAGAQVLLPARAVIDDEGQRFVFVEQGAGRYRRTRISVGREREGVVPVVEGLAETARIVTEGTLLLEAAWAGAPRS